jgi:carbon monoxide dehydrogenase subunit G
MSVWFEGKNEIDCGIQEVQQSVGEFGAHYVGIVGCMPGMTSVELLDETSDSVTIKTNEGIMKRTNIAVDVEAERVRVELDEEYQAGSRVTTTSHFVDEFASSPTGVTHHIVVRDVNAPGLLGFFYRKFGSSKMGKAFLVAYASYFENRKG